MEAQVSNNMETLLKYFPHAHLRSYKGGIEIRTNNLDFSIEKAKKIIKERNLNVEIFEKDPILSSFSVREKDDSTKSN